MPRFNSVGSQKTLSITSTGCYINFVIVEPHQPPNVITIEAEDAEAAALAVLESGGLPDSDAANLLRKAVQEAKEEARKAKKLTERRNKYVREISERAGWGELSDNTYELAPRRIQAAVDLIIELDDQTK